MCLPMRACMARPRPGAPRPARGRAAVSRCKRTAVVCLSQAYEHTSVRELQAGLDTRLATQHSASCYARPRWVRFASTSAASFGVALSVLCSASATAWRSS